MIQGAAGNRFEQTQHKAQGLIECLRELNSGSKLFMFAVLISKSMGHRSTYILLTTWTISSTY